VAGGRELRRLVVVLLALGCGREFPPGALQDAGPDEDGGGFEPTPPAPPEPPRMTPCPKGWREVTDPDSLDLVTCDPWPKGGPQDCAAVDEAHFPGEAGCRRVGTACPVGDWAEGIPAGASVLHVKAGAPAGGDGTRAAPFARIAEALVVADEGDTLALSKGTFDEAVVVREAVTLWGACVAETLVASSAPSESAATLSISGAGSTLRNLRVSGARWGVSVSANEEVSFLDAVVVHGASVLGVVVNAGGHLGALDLVVRDTQAASDGWFGHGLTVHGGARAELSTAVFERNRATGFLVGEVGTEVVATDVSIRDTQARGIDGLAGYGLELLDGARAELLRAAFERNRSMGIFVDDADTELVATDLSIRDTQARESDGGLGYGLAVSGGARAEFSRAVLERNRSLGMAIHDAGGEIVATDLVVRGTQARESDGDGGYGLQVSLGARAEVSRSAFERNRTLGLLLVHVGTALIASDLRVADTASRQADGDFGDGLQLQREATATLVRARIDRNHRFGVVAYDVRTVATLEDTVVEATAEVECFPARCDAAFGTGIGALDGALVTATRLRSSGNVLCGVQLAAGGEIDLHEGEVSGNLIGVNVQTEGFDLARLQDRVLYVDNERDLDSAILPVPLPVEAP